MRPTLSTFTRSVYPPASNKPTAASFALVRDILTERRQHFREILANGAVRGAGENAAASSSQAAGSSKSALNTKPFKPRASGADKKKGKSKVGGEFVEVQLPNGHPFISGK
jgi:hypothetical protein